MAGDKRGRYFSLGDLEVSGCCFKKKLQRPIGRRQLTSMINMDKMETID